MKCHEDIRAHFKYLVGIPRTIHASHNPLNSSFWCFPIFSFVQILIGVLVPHFTNNGIPMEKAQLEVVDSGVHLLPHISFCQPSTQGIHILKIVDNNDIIQNLDRKPQYNLIVETNDIIQ